jgi:16S rRNA C1402 (ribose-2'-O) methylase RsmI
MNCLEANCASIEKATEPYLVPKWYELIDSDEDEEEEEDYFKTYLQNKERSEKAELKRMLERIIEIDAEIGVILYTESTEYCEEDYDTVLQLMDTKVSIAREMGKQWTNLVEKQLKVPSYI